MSSRFINPANGLQRRPHLLSDLYEDRRTTPDTPKDSIRAENDDGNDERMCAVHLLILHSVSVHHVRSEPDRCAQKTRKRRGPPQLFCNNR